MNLQLPLPGLSFTPLGADRYIFSSSIAPMVRVNYLDGAGVQRAKLVQAPMQLTGTVTSTVNPSTVVWWAFWESGSISDPLLSGTTLSFVSAASIHLIAIPDEPANFPILQGFTCSQQPPVQAQCTLLYPLESYCLQSSLIPGSSSLAVPFAPLGPMPYRNPTVTPVDSQPYVLRVIPLTGDVATIDYAFPVLLSYTDSNNQIQTQSTFLFMSLIMADVANIPNTRMIADLAVFNIIPSNIVTPPALTIQTLVLTGSIAAVGDRIQALTTDAVQCGAVPADACQAIFPPPTAEITG